MIRLKLISAKYQEEYLEGPMKAVSDLLGEPYIVENTNEEDDGTTPGTE